VRQAAFKALGVFAGNEDLPALVALLGSAPDAGERKRIERSILGVLGRLDSMDTAEAPLIGGLGSVNNSAKSHLLALLSRVGSDGARAAVEAALDSPDGEVVKAAIRALGDWPNADPAKALLDVAKKETDSTRQTLALRGYTTLIGLPSDRNTDETIRMYRAALKQAQDASVKKTVLAGLSKIHHLDALNAVQKLIDDPHVAEEAQAAYAELELVMGTKEFHARDAKITGNGAGYMAATNKDCIGNWSDPTTWVSWPCHISLAGTYKVTLLQALADQSGSKYKIILGEQELQGVTRSTGDWLKFEDVEVGTINIPETGDYTLAFRPVNKVGGYVFDLRSVTLNRVDGKAEQR
jgi:hypothetical protein